MSSHRRGATASVRRNLLRHEFAQTRGDRNEFRSTCRRAGRPQAFAEIYCGMSSHRRGATASVRRNLLRHEFAQTRGDRNEFRSTCRRAGRPQAFAEIYFGMSLHRRGVTEMNFGLHAGARGDRKRSPKFIAARVCTGAGRPK